MQGLGITDLAEWKKEFFVDEVIWDQIKMAGIEVVRKERVMRGEWKTCTA